MKAKDIRTIAFYLASAVWMMVSFVLILGLPERLTLALAIAKVIASLTGLLMLGAWWKIYLILVAKRLIHRLD